MRRFGISGMRLGAALAIAALVVSAAAADTATEESAAVQRAARVEVPAASSRFILTRPVGSEAPQRRIPAIGRVISDPVAITDVNAAISGQVAEVFVLPGSIVAKGDPIASVTSPDFIFTQRSYLGLLANEERLEILRGEGNLPNYLEGARDNLRWWGMTEGQIDALIESGRPVERLNLVAPDAGIVTEVLVRPGDMIDAGDRTMQNFIVLGRAVARILRADAPLTLEVTAYAAVPLGGPEARLQRPPELSVNAVTPPAEMADQNFAAPDGARPGPAGLPDAGTEWGDLGQVPDSGGSTGEVAPVDMVPLIGGSAPAPHGTSARNDPPAEAGAPADTGAESAAPPAATDEEAVPASVEAERDKVHVLLPRGGPDGGAIALPLGIVVPDIDPTTQQARALVSLKGLGHDFALGQSLPVEIVIQPSSGVWLPAEAVLGPDVVYVTTDGGYERREIEVADRTSGWLRAAEGIEPGEEVVLRGKTLLEGAYRRGSAVAAGDHHHH
ncbi:efflux RND transporter periplasmic adaptor subunit [Amaricoccus macauensis]|uniref:efflux RND transporter periplasmic adaptor subunit n=1 Tax=Amaricoccus macauensis TaxID=57001 RepID=UPI001C8614F1